MLCAVSVGVLIDPSVGDPEAGQAAPGQHRLLPPGRQGGSGGEGKEGGGGVRWKGARGEGGRRGEKGGKGEGARGGRVGRGLQGGGQHQDLQEKSLSVMSL